MNLLEIFHSFFECNFFFSKYIFTSLFISDKKRENTNHGLLILLRVLRFFFISDILFLYILIYYLIYDIKLLIFVL